MLAETGTQEPENRQQKAKKGNKKLPPVETRFKKGVSGNPAGRPKKLKDIENEARNDGMMALQTLRTAMTSEDAPWPARVNAAKEILDRGFGKARQDHKHEHTLTLAQEFEKFIRAANGDDARIIDGRVEEADTLLEG